MDANEYQTLAMKTLNPALGKKDVLINAVMGLCGESGEVIDLVKKHLAQGHELDREKMINELGDVAWYLAECAAALDADLNEVFEKNIEKLRRRYPDGFDAKRSIERDVKRHSFYGEERVGENIKALFDDLLHVWAADTCAPRLRDGWSSDDPTLGQCSVTAFLVQDMLGGTVRGILRDGGNYHCYNVVDGVVFDLTSEQFSGETLEYSDGDPVQSREVHFAKEEKRERYELLKSRLAEYQKREIINDGEK